MEKTINGYPRREKKSGLGQKWKVSTVDIRIKKSGLKFINSKVPSSGHAQVTDHRGFSILVDLHNFTNCKIYNGQPLGYKLSHVKGGKGSLLFDTVFYPEMVRKLKWTPAKT